DFADELTRKPWDVERLRRFAAACLPGPVLDVGCGAAGHVGRFLAELDTRADRPVIGVDFSERSAALARRLNPALSFVAGDVGALPVAGGVCAGVLAFYSLIYAGDETTAALLAELRRVLRDGGRLLAAVHAGTGAQRFTEYKGAAIDVELHHRQPQVFAAQVRHAGFVVGARLRDDVTQHDRGDLAGGGIEDVHDLLVPEEGDLGMREGAVLHDLRCAQRLAPVDDDHPATEPREVERLLECRVAAAHDHDVPVLEEEAVARRARRHAVAHGQALRRQPEHLGGGAGGDDDGLRLERGIVGPHDEGPAGEIDPGDVLAEHVGAEALGLL